MVMQESMVNRGQKYTNSETFQKYCEGINYMSWLHTVTTEI